MKNAQIENIHTCQELTECLNEASNQIKIKEQIINELISKNENHIKENNNIKLALTNLEQEKEIIKNNNANNLNKVNDDMNNLNKKIIELNNEIKNKDNNTNN